MGEEVDWGIVSGWWVGEWEMMGGWIGWGMVGEWKGWGMGWVDRMGVGVVDGWWMVGGWIGRVGGWVDGWIHG